MQQPQVVGIGEVLWDVFPEGRNLGGAPANFAWYAAQRGCSAGIVSAVGDDQDGRDILEFLQRHQLTAQAVATVPDVPTGRVTVAVDAMGQPDYTIHDPSAWDRIPSTDTAMNWMRETRAVCFGSVAQRGDYSRCSIRALVAATPRDAFRMYDVNFRKSFYSAQLVHDSLELANVLKINDDELLIIRDYFDIVGDDAAALRWLTANYALHTAILTRGVDGSLVWSGNVLSEQPAVATDVVDTVGAGDAFGAAFVTGLIYGGALDEIHERAARIAAFVCAQPGAMTLLPQELR
jgi:fructokinase